MVLLGLALPLVPNSASAQPVDIPLTWGGDFWTRPRLTGSWDGLRDELGKKGVVLDIDMLLTPQGVASGGRSRSAELWGNTEYTLNADTGKMGLWPGGFFKFAAISGFGSSVLGDSGGIVPVNTGALVPRVGDPATGLINATFMQFLSPKFGLIAGKLDMLDIAQDGEFTGNYRTQFMNAAFSFPMTSGLIPLSAFGGGVIALPCSGARPQWHGDEQRSGPCLPERRDVLRRRSGDDQAVRSCRPPGLVGDGEHSKPLLAHTGSVQSRAYSAE
jgi:porin